MDMLYYETKKTPKTLFVATLQVAVVVGLFLLTVMQDEAWWPEAEMWLIRGIPVIMAIGALASLVMKKRIIFKRDDILVGAWWIVEAVRYYAGYGVFTPAAFVAFSETVFLYFALRMLFEAHPSHDGRFIIVCIMAGCLYEVATGLLQLIDGTSRHALFPVTGSMLNPGPYAAYLAIGLSVALVFFKDLKDMFFEIRAMPASDGWICRLAVVTVAAALFMLPVTWSRAAMLAAGMSLLFYYRYELKRWKYRYVFAFVAVVVLAAAYLLKAGSANGRMLMWFVSFISAAEVALFGAGLGGFSSAYASGMTDATFLAYYPGQFEWLQPLFRYANVTDNAFCEPLTILVEQGYVGFIFLLVLLCLVFIRLDTCSYPLEFGLLALIVFSLFSYPLHVVSYRIIFAVICAWGVSKGQLSDQYIGPFRRKVCVAVWCVVAAVVLVAGMMMRTVAEPRAAAAADYRMLSGVDAACVTDDYYELLPMMDDNADFLFTFGKALSEQGRHKESNDILRRGMKVSADPMFCVLAGRNCEAMGMPTEAADLYWKAYRMMPNRVYPLYRMMQLYKEREEWRDCRKVAARIVVLQEKVPSKATEEMKREAREFLETSLGIGYYKPHDDYYDENWKPGEPYMRKLRR